MFLNFYTPAAAPYTAGVSLDSLKLPFRGGESLARNGLLGLSTGTQCPPRMCNFLLCGYATRSATVYKPRIAPTFVTTGGTNTYCAVIA